MREFGRLVEIDILSKCLVLPALRWNMDKILEWDKRLFIFLNSYHADWLDPVMHLFTKTWFWLPLYLFLLILIVKVYRKGSVIILFSIAIMITLSNEITSSLMKPYFVRLRPSQDPALTGIVHLVNGEKGGLYGFASSHAANTFATAMFLWLLLRKKYAWTPLLFLWAIVMTYTRIYLGFHYPGDILVGGAVGIFFAWLCFTLCKWLQAKAEEKNLFSA
jgi:undecaprenyl-diphosphatase